MTVINKKVRRNRRSGFSLIELLFAMLVLVIGLLGGMIIILTAIATNARNRFDTAEIALAQSTMDRILVLSASSTAQSTEVTDCNGTVHVMNTTGSDAGSGAPVTTLQNISNGNQIIDFSQAPVAGYQMTYTLCAAGGVGTIGNPQVYDVRWNIQNIANTNQNAQLVLVAAKSVNEGNNGFQQTRIFNLPVTLRGIRGN
ncbi:MAG TPA: prepilin-type N-terminal cleavage/methylation domain-containing protein [Terriglobales bacterium]|nr:prepilin-type N-terminal cleavage/methylation domain-containing protein [Terriglobales bacterium]